MKRFISFMVVVLTLAAGIVIGYALAKWGAPSSAAGGPGNSEGVTTVQTVPLRRGKIIHYIRVYGTVAANPMLEDSLSVPFESRIMRVYVRKDQRVLPNQPLLQIRAAPAELLKLADAQNRVKAAAAQLRLTEGELKLQLAKQADIIAARSALTAASLELASIRRMGVGSLVTLRAPQEATVADTPVIPGQLAPRGQVLVDLLPVTGVQVELGVLPPNVRRLRLGQKVDFSVATQGGTVRERGSISMIGGRIDPVSGFVHVCIAPDKPDGLIIGQYATGELDIASNIGLIVPHSAVLPIGGQEDMYTVKAGRAVLHHVKRGLFNHREIEVSGPGLHAGEPVVTVGNAELTNGIAVQTKQGSQP